MRRPNDIRHLGEHPIDMVFLIALDKLHLIRRFLGRSNRHLDAVFLLALSSIYLVISLSLMRVTDLLGNIVVFNHSLRAKPEIVSMSIE